MSTQADPPATAPAAPAAPAAQDPRTEHVHVPAVVRLKRWLEDRVPWPREWSHPATYAQGLRLWRELYREEHTMVSSRRGRALHRLAADVERRGVPGDLVDCGVWNGGSTLLLSVGAPSRRAWAFDSFQGLPEPGELDGPLSGRYVGWCRGSEDKVVEAFRNWGDPERLRTVPGWFEDTFSRVVPGIKRVAVLHADSDWHDPVLLTLETFYDRLSPGGYVLIDDYGHWEGAQRATDEFRARRGITAPLRKIDYTGVYWRK